MINKLNRRILLVLAIIAQVSVLFYMSGKREFIHQNGTEVYLRSAPIDPRDPFRGDFVRLCYDVSSVHSSDYKGVEQIESFKDGDIVYAVLAKQSEDVFGFDYLTDEEVEGAVYIKGRVHSEWRFACGVNISSTTKVKYGIEQYFVQQGKGIEMEERLGERTGMQVPMELQLGIGGDGTAVIKGHRWSKLGVQLEIIRAVTDREAGPDFLSPKVKFTIKNVSENPVVIANPGDNCAFSLSFLNGEVYSEKADVGCAEKVPADVPLIHLNPQEQYSTEMDLSLPRWFIESEGKRVETGSIVAGWQPYRLIYRAPQIEGVWQGQLSSPSFDASGRID